MGFLTRIINGSIFCNYTSILRALKLQKSRLTGFNTEYRLTKSIHNTYCTQAGLYKVDDKVKNYFNYLMDVHKKNSLNNEPISEFVQPNMIERFLNERLEVFSSLKYLEELAKEDTDMKKLAEAETEMYNKQLNEIDEQLLNYILENFGYQNYSNIILEISSGVGGSESMIFVNDLYNMYIGYMERTGIKYEIINLQKYEPSGMRAAIVLITDDDAYRNFMYEAGVHRVQRVPATERQGRVHTSTAKVVIIPELSDVQIVIHEKDVKIEAKRASGAGGQHVNSTNSSIRITHLPTGISVTSEVCRSQLRNRKMAMMKLRNILYEQELEKQLSFTGTLRKEQQGSGLRNEKIRTYNYPRNRITDHRVPGVTVHNLREFMEGGPVLEKLMNRVYKDMQRNIFLQLVEKTESKSRVNRNNTNFVTF